MPGMWSGRTRARRLVWTTDLTFSGNIPRHCICAWGSERMRHSAVLHALLPHVAFTKRMLSLPGHSTRRGQVLQNTGVLVTEKWNRIRFTFLVPSAHPTLWLLSSFATSFVKH